MKHRWTDEELQQVKAKRVRGGVEGHAGNLKGDGHKPARGQQSHRLLGIRSAEQPVSNPAPSPQKPQYKSKLELAWATRLEVMRRNGEIDGWWYEPFTFRLAEGNRYRVDFIAWKWVEGEGVDGAPIGRYVTTAYECKGWHRNMRAALIALKWSAQKFPFLAWKKVVRNGKSGFEVYDVVV